LAKEVKLTFLCLFIATVQHEM